MRCPACGFHSFEHMDHCKKCGQDLKEFKARYGFFGRFMPQPSKEAPEEASQGEEKAQELSDPYTDLDYDKEADDFQIPDPEFWEPERLDKPRESQDLVETPSFSQPGGGLPDQPAGKDDENSADLESLLADLDYKKEVEDFKTAEGELWAPEKPEEPKESPGVLKTSPISQPDEDIFELPPAMDDESVADNGGILAGQDNKKEVEDFQVPEPEIRVSGDLEGGAKTLSPGRMEMDDNSISEEKAGEEFTFEVSGEPAWELRQESDEPFLFSDEQAGLPDEEEPENLLGLPETEDSGPEPESLPEAKADHDDGSREKLVKVFEEKVGTFEDVAEGVPKAAEAVPEIIPETTQLVAEEVDEEELAEDYSPLETVLFPGEEASGTENQIFPRLGAWLADCSILSVIFLVFVVLGKVGLDSQPRQGLFPTQAALLVELLIPYFFLFFALCFGYFTVFHFLTGQTPGKMLFHIRVEDENGFPLLFSQAFLRSAGGLLSFLLLGFGYLMICFNPERRGWNDRLAGTRVVRVAPPS